MVRGSPRLLACLLLGVAQLVGCGPADEASQCTDESAELYARRIEPILLDDRPSSCNQCHLSGVDLSLFVRETPCETMACLVELELVDLEAPDESLILQWISRAMPESELITEDVIQAEYDAFREWIVQRSECGDDFCPGVTCGAMQPQEMCEIVDPGEEPPPPITTDDCSDLAIERLFMERVYPWRGRCFPCHFDSTTFGPMEAPRWIHGSPDCELGSLVTMRNVVRMGAVNVEAPDQSLLLLKPLAESAGGVVHGGHDKFADVDDPAYVSFLSWIEHYARCAP